MAKRIPHYITTFFQREAGLYNTAVKARAFLGVGGGLAKGFPFGKIFAILNPKHGVVLDLKNPRIF